MTGIRRAKYRPEGKRAAFGRIAGTMLRTPDTTIHLSSGSTQHQAINPGTSGKMLPVPGKDRKPVHRSAPFQSSGAVTRFVMSRQLYSHNI
jgi:hypothetical protein